MTETDFIKQPLRILHLEDNARDAALVRALLEADGIECEIERVQTRAEFETALTDKAFDLILSDFSLPSFDGLSAVRLARETAPCLPVILVSGAIGEEQAIESLKSGATDYVLKHRPERLPTAVRRALDEARTHAERQQAEEALRKSQEHFRRVIEDIFTFMPESLLVFSGNLDLFRHNKAFEDLVRSYAPKLNYTESELTERLLKDIRTQALNGGTGEIRIPPKNRDEKQTGGPDHSG